MPVDYLKDLIEKAKKTPGAEGEKSKVEIPKDDISIPPAPPIGQPEQDIESKISAVRDNLKNDLNPKPVEKPRLEIPPAQELQREQVEFPAPEMSEANAFSSQGSLAPKPEIDSAEFDSPVSKQAPAEMEIPPEPVPQQRGFSQPSLFDEAKRSQNIEMDFGEEDQKLKQSSSTGSFPSAAEAASGISKVEEEISKKHEKILVDSYGPVKIYKVPGEKQLYYFIPVPRSTGSEKRIIRTIKEAATRLITISPFRIRDPEQRRAVYRQRIMEILESASEIQIPKGKREFYTEAVIREMVGYGLIDQLIKDDRLEEIMVTGSKKPVYIFHRDYDMMKTNIEFFTDDEVVDLINRIGREVGRRVDFSSPLLDARLADGSRVNATINPISVSGPTITIRKFRKDPLSIVDMVNFGTVNSEVAAFLWLTVEGLETRPANIVIAGGTGSGKTTTLNVLASFIPENERVITIEDTAELNLPLDHWIRFESRPPGLENKGEITLDILTKNSLRMRPDRIIVGEIRHDEAFSLFTAMNTGHDGSIGTVHANSAQETLIRITNPPMNVPEAMLSGLNFVIVEHRLHDRKKGTIRRVTEIGEVTGVLEGKAQVQAIFKWDAVSDELRRTGVPSNYLRELAKRSGLNSQQIERELKKRKSFIEGLIKKNIRSIDESTKRMKSFLVLESEK